MKNFTCPTSENVSLKRIISVLFFSIFVLISVNAQTITLKTSNEFVIYNNKSCLPLFEGPHASYVAYEICNDTGVVTQPLTADFSITGPGYALSGDQAASQYIGTLDINECVTFFWLVEYPCEPEGQAALINIDLFDDTATLVTSSSDPVSNIFGTESGSTGIVGNTSINTTSVGQISMFDVEFTFGTTPDGGEISFQPIGNIDFDAECFQLIGVEILQSDFPCIAVGTVDNLFFQLTA